VKEHAKLIWLTIDEIQRLVAGHYQLTKEQLLCKNRSLPYRRPRQVAMYLTRTLTAKSLVEIGRKFGGRDHTTVMHAMRRVDGLTKSDPDLAQEIQELETLLRDAGRSKLYAQDKSSQGNAVYSLAAETD
jgi:chromosomal replication initiator protein